MQDQTFSQKTIKQANDFVSIVQCLAKLSNNDFYKTPTDQEFVKLCESIDCEGKLQEVF